MKPPTNEETNSLLVTTQHRDCDYPPCNRNVNNFMAVNNISGNIPRLKKGDKMCLDCYIRFLVDLALNDRGF